MRGRNRWLAMTVVVLLAFAAGMGLRAWQRHRATSPGNQAEPAGPGAPVSPVAPVTPPPPVAPSGPLKVVKVHPEPGEVGIMRWSRLLVLFDRPVTEAAIKAGLAVDPPLALRFEPYGDTGWAVSPLTGWAEARLYSVRLSGQLAAAGGEVLGSDVAWSFRTAALPPPDDVAGPGAAWETTLGLTAPVWSPDGQRLAVVRRGDDHYDWQLAVIDIASGKQSIVGPADPVPPVWLDGSHIAVAARSSQPGAGVEFRQYDLSRGTYRILASPTDLRQYAFLVTPHRAPDGGWLLEVNQGGLDAHSDVSQSFALLNAAGGVRWLDEPAGTKWFLGWDGAGRAVFLNTFENFNHSHDFRYDIMAWDPGDDQPATLAGGGPIANFGGAACQGDEVALWTWTAVDTGNSIDHRPARLLRYRIQDNELLDLLPRMPAGDSGNPNGLAACVEDSWPSWAPDGLRLAFASNRGSSWDIWTMNADGSDPRRLTTDEGEDTHPAWSPDGTTIAFLSTRSGVREVWLMDASGANQRPAR
ncbi:MAG: hypothetical protein ACM3XN_10765 [Chloroflexota bacterium]